MRRTSIRFRLMVLMICLTTLPVMIVTWIASNNTRNSVEKEIVNANISRMMWADQYLNDFMQSIDSIFNTVQINPQLAESMNDIDSQDMGIQYRTNKYIRDTLAKMFSVNSQKLDELTLYVHLNKKAYSENHNGSGDVAEIDISEGVWSRMVKKPVNMYFKYSDGGVYAFRSINRFEDQKLLGGVSIRIRNEIIKKLDGILKSETESAVYLVNDEMEVLAGTPKNEKTQEIQELLRDIDLRHSEVMLRSTKSCLYFIKIIRGGQLTVIKSIPNEAITQSARAMILAGILTGALFAGISVVLAIFVSFHISGPIVSLAKTMRLAQIQNFEVKSVQSNDEIGLLEHCYNSMMQRIKELIENQYQKNIELKNAQLMALQAQINPHFLNNTLNLIGGIALTKNAPEIYQITRTIGELLRYSINSHGDMVILEDELKHVRNYLFIQENRFAGRCTAVFSTDKTAYECRLPKFSLQPIVENAFEHGLQQREGAWFVEIRIKKVGSRVVIMVRDNGIGLSPDTLEQVRAHLRTSVSEVAERVESGEAKKRKGIGLRNVNARLKLQFGEGYGIRFFSRMGVGSLVVLVLPVSKRVEGQDDV